MNFLFDGITLQILEEFSSITLSSLLTSILLSFALGLFILLIYRITYAGSMFSKSFALSLVLLSMITSLIILTISSNVVLSLGMVGALSIVRFRTAVKEPMDTIFMFWAICVGIITGAGYVPVAIIATLLIGGLFLALTLAGARFTASAYLVVIHYHADLDASVIKTLSKTARFKLKSKNMSGDSFEMVAEMKLTEKQMERLSHLRSVEGIQEVDFLSYNGGTML
ncbi:MAG: DUF4956 domain-containing protein [Lachnospiraceae bacterium]|nr:DUF4956 domain-containing protein [Lachnospiraceae bacterium]